jgi:hypothetical protein
MMPLVFLEERVMSSQPARDEGCTASGADALTRAEALFAVQVATSVTLRTLTDEAAREVFGSYAMACRCDKREQSRLWAALVREYRRCRERLDLCS